MGNPVLDRKSFDYITEPPRPCLPFADAFVVLIGHKSITTPSPGNPDNHGTLPRPSKQPATSDDSMNRTPALATGCIEDLLAALCGLILLLCIIMIAGAILASRSPVQSRLYLACAWPFSTHSFSYPFPFPKQCPPAKKRERKIEIT